MWHVTDRRKMCTGFWQRNLRKRHNLEDLDINERKILKLILKKHNEMGWTECMWLRTANGMLL
jgi:hypothetical protein